MVNTALLRQTFDVNKNWVSPNNDDEGDDQGDEPMIIFTDDGLQNDENLDDLDDLQGLQETDDFKVLGD